MCASDREREREREREGERERERTCVFAQQRSVSSSYLQYAPPVSD